MSCYTVIDTNVLVSALLSSKEDAATVQILQKVFSGEIIPIYSNKIVREYQEVLSREKFNFSEAMVRYLLSAIESFGLFADPSPSGMKLPDMKDLPFYEAVMEKRSNHAFLVTGNIKHFPKEPFIVTCRELLNILMDKKSFD